MGTSLKVDFPELSDVTDWSLLEVTMPDGVSYSRRTNSSTSRPPLAWKVW
ncbi:hypothetical protein [Enterobacter phage 01_vB_Eclo_IJM]|nr:hypothetical protein [Enterobacter phage 01_vB_Eclo_IJM]